jgi:hypothetical protein
VISYIRSVLVEVILSSYPNDRLYNT